MKTENTPEDIEKPKTVAKALDNLNGVLIPYNLIKHCIMPFRKWLIPFEPMRK